jgi:hypothetical protein
VSSRRYAVQTVTATSPAAASTVAATEGDFQNLKRFEHFIIDALIQGGTGGTLDIHLQRAVGATWVDWFHFTQFAAGAAQIRVTFDSTTAVATLPTTVGADLTPALAAATLAGSHPGDKVRIVFVAGAGTSAGTAQTISISGVHFGGGLD